MKKFKFKFNTVLKVRKTREREFLRHLARTQRVHQECIQKKQDLINELNQAWKRRETFAQTSETITRFHLEESYIQGAKRRIVQSEAAIQRAAKAVQKALQVYLLAKRESKAIELLLEQAKAEHQKAVLKFEDRNLDDFVIMRTSRSNEGYEIESE
ncbi:MAG: flagellar export protein FliJ [Bdellovibrionia bacterium]